MSILHLFEFTSVSFLSAPETAEKCRTEIEKQLLYNKKVEIDFSNIYVTTGFLEHLLMPLLRKRGDALLQQLFFANCSEAAEFSINQVVKSYRSAELSSN